MKSFCWPILVCNCIIGTIHVFAQQDQPAGQVDVYLYFLDKDQQYLAGEKHSISGNFSDTYDLGKQLITMLIHGPRLGLVKTLPKETQLLAFYISDNGIAYVDLSKEVSEFHPGGCYTEYLSIYSIVDTLMLNIKEIKGVKVLINGTESPSLAGHIDLSQLFKVNLLIIR
ncbi:MAG: GerMN domain-containing protein [Desulfobacterales bacterium]|nr:GerMN domain-containing protein [Desulfobacterales bacterium]